MARPQPVDIPFPLSSQPGQQPQEGAGRLVNCYAEPLGKTAAALQKWSRSSGMSVFATQATAGFRGAILVNNLLFAAFANVVKTIASDGTVTSVGTLTGTKPVTWARNNKATPDIQCVDPDNGAFTVTSSSVSSFSGGGALPAPNSVCSQDGYFFWGIGDNTIFAAGPNSTTVNSQTFTTAQSRPTGGLLRVIPYKGLLFIFCTSFCEIFVNTSNTFPAFPYTRYKVLDRGLIGPSAIAGWQDGFGNLMWVGDDYGVYRFDANLEPEKISPPDLDRLIRAVSDKTTLSAGCYVHDGRSVWHISSPAWSWEFNLNTQKWNERSSIVSGAFARWRGIKGVNAFGKWLLGDAQSGNILAIDPTTYLEAGAMSVMRIESGPVANFPAGIRIAQASFDFVPGVGVATAATSNIIDPQVAISWSRDGGANFGNPILRRLGKQGEKLRRVAVNNCGIASPFGMRWRLDISDPVYVGLMRGVQSAEARSN
jgi:hypothetical protein